MTSIGETLRHERMKRNLELEQISQDLKISSRFLQAIEDERFEKLPGGVFAKSFVRQYARYSAWMKKSMPPPCSRCSNRTPGRSSCPRIRSLRGYCAAPRRGMGECRGAAFQLVVVAARAGPGSGRDAGVLGSVRLVAAQPAGRPASRGQAGRDGDRPRFPSGCPAANGPGAPCPASGCSGARRRSRSKRATRQPPRQPLRTRSQPAQSPVADANRPAPQAAAPAAPAPADAANPGAAVQVELTATEPVWVLARADGKFLFSGTIDANQSRTLEADGTLTLRLGNAGGVNITLNGKPSARSAPKGRCGPFSSLRAASRLSPRPSPRRRRPIRSDAWPPSGACAPASEARAAGGS